MDSPSVSSSNPYGNSDESRKPKSKKGSPLDTDIEYLIRTKHNEYMRKSKQYMFLYYFTRVIVGVSAAVMPFIIKEYTNIATILSLLIIISTAFDTIFNPKDRWAVYSKATDLLTLAVLRQQGKYETNQELIDIIMRTESSQFEKLIDMNALTELVDNMQHKSTSWRNKR